jgi:hypothetical protein
MQTYRYETPDEGRYDWVFVAIYTFVLAIPFSYALLNLIEKFDIDSTDLLLLLESTPVRICVALLGGFTTWCVLKSPSNNSTSPAVNSHLDIIHLVPETPQIYGGDLNQTPTTTEFQVGNTSVAYHRVTPSQLSQAISGDADARPESPGPFINAYDPLDIGGEDVIEVQTTPPRLALELVPKTCWFSNLRSELSAEQWEGLKKITRKRSASRCEICGGRGPQWPVETHEVWSYDDTTRTQHLSAIQALCPSCHLAKHFGMANIKGKSEEALEQLQKVNGWDYQTAIDYVELSFQEWQRRSTYSWKLELSHLKQYGFSDSDIQTLQRGARQDNPSPQKMLPSKS